jgi:hypothetical protein
MLGSGLYPKTSLCWKDPKVHRLFNWRREADREGLLSSYHRLTVYFPAVVLAVGQGMAAR